MNGNCEVKLVVFYRLRRIEINCLYFYETGQLIHRWLECQQKSSWMDSGRRMFKDPASLFSVDCSPDHSMVTLRLGGETVTMVIDSGAQVNAISSETYGRLVEQRARLLDVQERPLVPLRGYGTDALLTVDFSFKAEVYVKDEWEATRSVEEFFVIKNASRNLLSKSTASTHHLLVMGEVARESASTQGKLLLEVSKKDGSNTISNIAEASIFPLFNMVPVHIEVLSSATPTKRRYTCVPINLRAEVEKQLRELEDEAVIERVNPSKGLSWVSSMLVVQKSVGKVRLVFDLRGPNKVIVREPFPMPTLETILSKLSGCKIFSTIDLSSAYHHVPLDEDSRDLTTFWSGENYYRFTRLPFGISCAPDIFQRTLQELVLEGCEAQINYMDDILVATPDLLSHERALSSVLNRLTEHNAKINLEKSKLRCDKVQFLGFNVSQRGLSITEDRMAAFKKLRTPSSCKEVRSLLGTLTFIERFIIDRAARTATLRKIANSRVFQWSPEAQKEFEMIKSIELMSVDFLEFYNKDHLTILFTDAGPKGLGAVLTQCKSDGDLLHVICCASRALTPTEQRYPQQHREALAIVWAIERLRFYLMGKKFIIRTDNRANEFLFGNEAMQQGKRANSRQLAWTLRLQDYDFVVERVRGVENIADSLSRLVEDDNIMQHPEEVFAISNVLPQIKPDEILVKSQDDNLYWKLKMGIKNNDWSGEIIKFREMRNDFSVVKEIVMLNERYYIPWSMRETVLKIAHLGHSGASSMKRLLREHFWWPGMTVDADHYYALCRGCLVNSRALVVPPMTPRALPERPMQEVHIDFLEIRGCASFLVATDAYSRHLWVFEMKLKTAKATNRALMKLCSQWGVPEVWQCDNGPPFSSGEFRNFWSKKKTFIRYSIPFAAHTNGLIERHNEPIKRAIKAELNLGKKWRPGLREYIKAYNTRPHSTTKFSPHQLLQGKRYHEYFPIAEEWDGEYRENPTRREVAINVARAKKVQKKNYDARMNARWGKIEEGDWVVLSNTRRQTARAGSRFLPTRFKVLRITGPKVVIMSEMGKVYIRWIGHIKPDVTSRDGFPEAAVEEEIVVSPDAMEDVPVNHEYMEQIENQGSTVPVSTYTLRDRKLISAPARYLDCVFVELH